MTESEFGDVVLVPFPFTDQTTTKKRPAVVVSSAAYQAERPDLIILAITSRSRSTITVGEAPVAQWQDAGLLKPSVFKPLLTTIEKGLVLQKLGRLPRCRPGAAPADPAKHPGGIAHEHYPPIQQNSARPGEGDT